MTKFFNTNRGLIRADRVAEIGHDVDGRVVFLSANGEELGQGEKWGALEDFACTVVPARPTEPKAIIVTVDKEWNYTTAHYDVIAWRIVPNEAPVPVLIGAQPHSINDLVFVYQADGRLYAPNIGTVETIEEGIARHRNPEDY